jgi:hypothetical protein
MPKAEATYLEAIGLPPTKESVAQLEVFAEALRIFASRNAAYGDVWKQYGALSNLLSVARKVDRLMHSWWEGKGAPAMHKDSLDDAIDNINYTAFFIRNAREGNITGSAPVRPVDELAERRATQET